MKIWSKRKREDGGAIIGYLVVVLLTMATLATVSSYTIQSIQLANRRQHMVDAWQYAQGGASLACDDIESAMTNTSGSLLENIGAIYVKNQSESSASQLVYDRTLTSPFANQTVDLQLVMTNSTAPSRIRVISTATVGGVEQEVVSGMEIGFGNAGAIISTSPGSSSSSASKGGAQQGNVSVSGGSGVTRVVGGAIANGKVNVSDAVVDEASEENYGTDNELPDYTDPGSTYQLFDFGRFTAVANAMGTHYGSLADFVTAASPGTNLEGVIVVEISSGNKLDAGDFPNGINIVGSLVFKFDGSWNPNKKLVNTAELNINAADLSGLDPADESTYTTGYPPVFADPKKDPSKVDITGAGYQNFAADDDLPAFMYNNAIFDIHGPANICGVVYSPVFMEIENKNDGQTQYFNGSIIGGGGIYFENGKSTAISIANYDAKVIDQLTTFDARGKTATVVYQR